MYISDKASLYGSYKSAEAAETLGITGALAQALQLHGHFEEFVFNVDCQGALDHVFEEQGAASQGGKDLMPCIILARSTLF